MKKCILFVAIIFTFINTSATANEWYEGGTLYHAPISEWLEADPRNVLATTSDLIIPTISEEIIHTLTMADLKKASDEVAACLYTSTVESSTYTLNGHDVVRTCMSQLKTKFPWLLTQAE